MATVSRSLPPQPCLDVPKREARELLDAFRAAQPEALDRVRGNHPRYRNADDATLKSAPLKLSDAQLVLAREYGFSNWMDLRSRILSNSEAHALDRAIRGRDVDLVEQLIRQTPALLHLPVRSGNWGPPMSHAANFGHLEVVQKIASTGDLANVRKFLDWQDEPCWHTAIDVTAVQWGRGFPLKNWVNEELLRLIEGG